MQRALVISVTAILIGTLATVCAQSADPNQKPQTGSQTHVLVVSGINRDPEEQQAKDKAVIRLQRFLRGAAVPQEHLRVLVDETSFARKGAKTSTAENVMEAITELAAAIKPEDRFIFYYVGQANIVAEVLRINLPGKDITGKQLAEWINKVKASSMLVVLDCPGAGLAIKALAAKGRIIVGGSRSDQRFSTRFSEYFIPALTDTQSDTDSDGKISLLEAFTATAKRLDDLYREQDLLKTETPLLEDDGNGIPSQQPWRYEHDKNDGLAASKFFF
ncbi:MAG: hypothetical protein ACYTEL_02470 [Planctomycetota bacterium]|jgi:hypothetical protein